MAMKDIIIISIEITAITMNACLDEETTKGVMIRSMWRLEGVCRMSPIGALHPMPPHTPHRHQHGSPNHERGSARTTPLRQGDSRGGEVDVGLLRWGLVDPAIALRCVGIGWQNPVEICGASGVVIVSLCFRVPLPEPRAHWGCLSLLLLLVPGLLGLSTCPNTPSIVHPR